MKVLTKEIYLERILQLKWQLRDKTDFSDIVFDTNLDGIRTRAITELKELEKIDINSLPSDNDLNDNFNRDILSSPKHNLKWNKTPTDIVELLTALFSNQAIEGTQKEFIAAMSEILNIDLTKEFYNIQTKLKGRETKSKFLQSLIESYDNWYIKQYQNEKK